MKPVVVLMGVCGCGKSTVGRLLASENDGVFIEGDEFHPPENVEKMSEGIPLTDGDRAGWLAALAEEIRGAEEELVVVSCSALKARYRKVLREAAPERVRLVFLEGSEELLRSRLEEREGHYMPAALLASQLRDLEVPQDALRLDVSLAPGRLAGMIKDSLGL